MFTGPVGPVEVFFDWPEAIFGKFNWTRVLIFIRKPSDEYPCARVSVIFQLFCIIFYWQN